MRLRRGLGKAVGDVERPPMATPTESDRWVLRLRSVPSPRIRLFCFPYAGGAASAFNGWAEGLPREVEICAVQLPGRESRFIDEPFNRLTPMVESLGQAFI